VAVEAVEQDELLAEPIVAEMEPDAERFDPPQIDIGEPCARDR
jgi:hypothetical protein